MPVALHLTLQTDFYSQNNTLTHFVSFMPSTATKYELMPLPDIIRRTGRKLEEAQLHSYCSQAWTHNFMWLTMTPAKVEPSTFMMDAFRVHFNGFHKFKQRVRFFPMPSIHPTPFRRIQTPLKPKL